MSLTKLREKRRFWAPLIPEANEDRFVPSLLTITMPIIKSVGEHSHTDSIHLLGVNLVWPRQVSNSQQEGPAQQEPAKTRMNALIPTADVPT